MTIEEEIMNNVKENRKKLGTMPNNELLSLFHELSKEHHRLWNVNMGIYRWELHHKLSDVWKEVSRRMQPSERVKLNIKHE